MSRVIIVTNRAKLGKTRPPRAPRSGRDLNRFPVKLRPWGELAAEKFHTANQLVQYRAASVVLAFMRALHSPGYRGEYVNGLIEERERGRAISEAALTRLAR